MNKTVTLNGIEGYIQSHVTLEFVPMSIPDVTTQARLNMLNTRLQGIGYTIATQLEDETLDQIMERLKND